MYKSDTVIEACNHEFLCLIFYPLSLIQDSLVQKKRSFGPKPSEFKNMTKKAARQLGATRMAKIRNSYPYQKLMVYIFTLFYVLPQAAVISLYSGIFHVSNTSSLDTCGCHLWYTPSPIGYFATTLYCKLNTRQHYLACVYSWIAGLLLYYTTATCLNN